jgi:hypothetical protein
MRVRLELSLLAVLLTCGCAKPGPDPAAGEYRKRLRAAMETPVTDRESRDQNSKLLIESVEHGALEGLNLAQVQAAFGQGLSCEGNALCSEQGFSDSDLYYPIGQRSGDEPKQLPILIVGLGPHGQVERVYTLKTHD